MMGRFFSQSTSQFYSSGADGQSGLTPEETRDVSPLWNLYTHVLNGDEAWPLGLTQHKQSAAPDAR
jgi:hypothetical protein